MVEPIGSSFGIVQNRIITLVSQDMSSLLRIYPSGVNITQLISVKFNETGYNNWESFIMLSLYAKYKLGFIDSIVVKPDVTSVEFKALEMCNDLVSLIIMYYEWCYP